MTAVRQTPPRRRWMVAAIAGVLLVGTGAAVAVLLADGSPAEAPRASSSPRPVSADEANRLAVMRFQSYRATGLHFDTEVVAGKATLRLNGDVDFRKKLGYAKIAGAGSSFTLQWDARTLVAWPSSSAAPSPPAKLPTGTPARRALAPSGSAIDAVLAVVLGLARDRPDNAQLIRRNGARWLGRERIASTEVDVLQGPAARGAPSGSGAALRYWLDMTGRPHRVEAFLGGGSRRTRIDLDATSFTAFARSALLPG